MLKKLSLLTGFAAGYVLGAKAGTSRYDQIMTKFDELRGKPQVQKATESITKTASDLGDKAKTTVGGVTSSTAPGKATAAPASPPKAPMPGAAASGSAPDVALSTGATGATGAPTTSR